jgi:N-acetyl-gamma-glutamyl-phosphate reductase
MKRIGIIGASGYAGHELTKLLSKHPGIELKVLNSQSFAGQKVTELYPDYDGDESFTGYSYDAINRLGLDLVFLALPHGLSMIAVQKLGATTRIIDLSPDYRFADGDMYEHVYGKRAPKAHGAVYGLPELFADQIKDARIVANPGCFATAAILSAYPIQEHASHIIFDCKSGWSGAGRDSRYAKDPSVSRDNIIPYNLTKHRHKYEIEQFITAPLSFTPHVLDTFRGLMCTAHILLKDDICEDEVVSLYQDFYRDRAGVRVSTEIPQLSDTQGTNLCTIGGFEIDEARQLVVVSTIDNLLKGAAGQAVQNMNLMLGFEETQGLPVYLMHAS